MELQKACGGSLRVYGHAKDTIPGVTRVVEPGDRIMIGETEIGVVHVPCHTTGHVVYAVLRRENGAGGDVELGGGANRITGDDLGSGANAISPQRAEAVFTGDAIINGGVGAFFHGGPRDCYDNLHRRLADVPDDALIFSGHEYMLMNLRFAKWLDEDDETTAVALREVIVRRHHGLSTMPSSFGVERRVNPYFRVADARVSAKGARPRRRHRGGEDETLVSPIPSERVREEREARRRRRERARIRARRRATRGEERKRRGRDAIRRRETAGRRGPGVSERGGVRARHQGGAGTGAVSPSLGGERRRREGEPSRRRGESRAESIGGRGGRGEVRFVRREERRADGGETRGRAREIEGGYLRSGARSRVRVNTIGVAMCRVGVAMRRTSSESHTNRVRPSPRHRAPTPFTYRGPAR